MADLIYGINPVHEALHGEGRQPLGLYVVKNDKNQRLQKIIDRARSLQLKVSFLPAADMERLVGHAHHQGAVLKIKPYVYSALSDLIGSWRADGRNAFFLLLDGVTDPHNFGAILRSAEVAGCHGVIVAKDRSCSVTSVVEKTAAGALSYLSLCQVTNLARAIDELKKNGVWCYGLAGEEGATDLFGADLKGDVALVVGSEGKGLRPNIRKHCDGLLAIPMVGKVGSLNASVAAGVALFEVTRQQRGSRA